MDAFVNTFSNMFSFGFGSEYSGISSLLSPIDSSSGIFSSSNMNKFSGFLDLGSGLFSSFAQQQKRYSDVEQLYYKAQEYQNRALEENYKYKMLNSSILLQSEQERKHLMARYAESGFDFSGSVLEIATQTRNVALEEMNYNERVRANLVNNLVETSYNYIKSGKRATKYGYLQDISSGLSLGLKAYRFSTGQPEVKALK